MTLLVIKGMPRESEINYWSDIATILTFIFAVLGFIRGLSLLNRKKTKIVLLFSQRLMGKPSNEQINKAIRPNKIYDEIEEFIYTGEVGNSTQIADFITHKGAKVLELKQRHSHISTFAVIEMPICIWLGYQIGDAIQIDTYRKSRLGFNNPWKWIKWWYLRNIRPVIKNARKVLSSTPTNMQPGEAINLIIHFSHPITDNDIPTNLRSNKSCKIGINNETFHYLNTKSQLRRFTKDIESILKEIDAKIGRQGEINIFCTIPTPFAIKLGQKLHVNGPKYNIYDKDAQGIYHKIITL